LLLLKVALASILLAERILRPLLKLRRVLLELTLDGLHDAAQV
jgi:hypothetical protein